MLEELVPNIKMTAELVQEISHATSEQSTGVEQINAAINQLSQVIQQNASSSEELAATSEELTSSAQNLASKISFFKAESNGEEIQMKLPEPDRAYTDRKVQKFELERTPVLVGAAPSSLDDDDFSNF